MASLDSTELKLKTTSTGGVSAEHSPYYRRLLSAGYKGFLQGSIGGGALYGTFGLVIGGLLAIAAAPAIGASALFLIPAAAGIGMLKGASTFGNIGSTAAINAESSDLSEQRRYLLDRYYDLPEGPEGDREAEAIKKELLARQADATRPPHFFHWKTVAIGAAVGAAIALGGLLLAPSIGSAAALSAGIQSLTGIHIASGLSTALFSLGSVGIASFGTLAGALTGATIGIDRYYIRKWFDHSEGVIHSGSHHESALIERSEQVARLKAAAKADDKTKQQLGMISSGEPAQKIQVTPAPTEQKSPTTPPVASLDKATPEKPTTSISAARREGLAAIHKAMEISAV